MSWLILGGAVVLFWGIVWAIMAMDVEASVARDARFDERPGGDA